MTNTVIRLIFNDRFVIAINELRTFYKFQVLNMVLISSRLRERRKYADKF